MKIDQIVNGDTATIVLEGWLDTQAAPALEAALNEIPEDMKAIVLECKSLEYISSSGIRQIVAVYKRMNGNLTLKNVSAEIMDVLKMTGLAKRLNIE